MTQGDQHRAVPDADVAAVQDYCGDRIAPQFRDEVRVECDQRGSNLTIFECRPPWKTELGPSWTRQPVAQLRYDPTSRRWTLYCADRNGHWHRYERAEATNRVARLLDEITEDPTGIFWG